MNIRPERSTPSPEEIEKIILSELGSGAIENEKDRSKAERSLGEVRDNQESKRFELVVDGHEAYLSYSYVPGGNLDLIHTEVPEGIRGRGAGDLLVKTSLEFARERQLKIIPTCPFVRKYLERHPEYNDLVSTQIKFK